MSGENPAARRKVKISLRTNPGCKVFVAGTFNAWNPTKHRLTFKTKEGLYSTTLSLAPGRYEYKFVVDGNWCADPEQHDWVPNQMGTLNSVLVVT